MTANHSKALAGVFDLAKKEQYEKALKMCSDFVESYPNENVGYRERAAVNLHKGDYDEALVDLQKLETLNSVEPSDYFDLGRTYLRLGQFHEAIEALSKAVDWCVKHENNYYMNSSLLLRALAHLEAGNTMAASADLENLPDSASFFVGGFGLQSKADLMERVTNRMTSKTKSGKTSRPK